MNLFTLDETQGLARKLTKQIIEQFGLDTNTDVQVAVTHGDKSLLPLVLMLCEHEQINYAQGVINADFVVVRDEQLEDVKQVKFYAENDVIALNIHHGSLFPWQEQEAPTTAQNNIEANVKQILGFIGEDPNRGGLLETPKRVAKAWLNTWASGYAQDPAEVLKVFEDGGETYDQMVTVVNIPFYSHCEHHLAPFFGTVSISYIPNGKIVGLSKLSRLADVFARRLQVQERLTDQIADALVKHLDAKGVGVVIKARHMCMESRGIGKQGSSTITTALRGAMRDEKATRAEFLRAVGQ